MQLGLAGALAFAWLEGATAEAQIVEPGALGPREGLSLHPYASLSGVYNSNVLLEPDHGTGEFGLWLSPGIEANYRRDVFRAGLDIGADLQRYFGPIALDGYYGRIAGFAEVAPLPGLTLRLADAWAPQPLNLGLPDDDAANLVQSNRVEAEARLRRELPREFVLDVGILGTRFDADSYEVRQGADLNGFSTDGGSIDVDYWDVTGRIELQRGFDRRTIGYARILARDRAYESASNYSFVEVSGLLGLRFRGPAQTELEIAGGYGQLNYRDGPTKPTALGLLELSGVLDGGWRWHAGVSRNFTTDFSIYDYAETSGRVGVEKELGPRTRATVEVSGGQFNSEAPDVGNQTYWAVEAALRRQLNRTMQAGLVFRHWQTHGEGSLRDITQNRVILELKYRR
jgi:hypothetical protein